MKKLIREQFISEHSRCSSETLRTQLYWADRWLDFAGGNHWDKNLVNKFRSKLEGEGYAPLTVRTALGIVKRCFDAAQVVFEAERRKVIASVDPNDPSAVAQLLKTISAAGPTWDLGKRWMPRAESSDIIRPRLTLDEIGQMINARSSLELPQVCYLALGSIYALRRDELCQVRREHIDFDEKTIFINTVKGGEKRKQLLADEIIPYLKEYSFQWEYSPFMMSFMFKRICAKSGVENREGMGWHSFRRAINTLLVDRFGELQAHIFLRWRLSSSSAMELRYYSADPLEIDKAVLESHPVVPLWR